MIRALLGLDEGAPEMHSAVIREAESTHVPITVQHMLILLVATLKSAENMTYHAVYYCGYFVDIRSYNRAIAVCAKCMPDCPAAGQFNSIGAMSARHSKMRWEADLGICSWQWSWLQIYCTHVSPGDRPS